MSAIDPIEHGDATPADHPSGALGIHGIVRFGEVANEAARDVLAAALVLAARPQDKWGVVAQTAGTAPGQYLWTGSAFARLDPGGAQAAASAAAIAAAAAQGGVDQLQAAQYAGAARSHASPPNGPFTLAAGGGAPGRHTIDGPAAGLIRFVERIVVTTTTATAGAIDVSAVLAEGTVFVVRDLAVTLASGVNLPLTGVMALAAGESIVVETKSPATGAVQLTYYYTDLPAAGYSLVRKQLTAGPVAGVPQLVELIPAPPAGFFRKIVAVGNLVTTNRSSAFVRNDDSASATVEFFIGPDVTGRTSALAAGSQLALAAMSTLTDLIATTRAINAALRANVTTPGRAVHAVLAYETLPIAA